MVKHTMLSKVILNNFPYSRLASFVHPEKENSTMAHVNAFHFFSCKGDIFVDLLLSFSWSSRSKGTLAIIELFV